MEKKFFTLILTAFATYAQASERPTTLEYKSAGRAPWVYEGVRISRDGTVIAFRGSDIQKSVARLSAEQAKSLFAEVDLFPHNILVDTNPDVSNCPTDMPHETYKILESTS